MTNLVTGVNDCVVLDDSCNPNNYKHNNSSREIIFTSFREVLYLKIIEEYCISYLPLLTKVKK